MVTNGPDKHPGAVAVEDEFGRVISLATFSEQVTSHFVLLSTFQHLAATWQPSHKRRLACIKTATPDRQMHNCFPVYGLMTHGQSTHVIGNASHCM